jgi:DNA adenine methylase
MQYLGGKSRDAREIASIVNAERVRRGGVPFWDPFCGGLASAVALAAGGPGIVSDLHPALVSLYQALRAGWDPPETITHEQYTAARAAPDSDPIKAFCGFGVSFGGRWFEGYARPNRAHPAGYAAVARRTLLRQIGALSGCAIERLDFLAVEPRRADLVIYCDPPYTATKAYSGMPPFDASRFWARARGWAAAGVPVFVSEYACPVPSDLVREKTRQVMVGLSGGARTERLFRVLP